jgi:hypothetical protein
MERGQAPSDVRLDRDRHASDADDRNGAGAGVHGADARERY